MVRGSREAPFFLSPVHGRVAASRDGARDDGPARTSDSAHVDVHAFARRAHALDEEVGEARNRGGFHGVSRKEKGKRQKVEGKR